MNPDEINPAEIDGLLAEIKKKQLTEIDYLRDLLDEYSEDKLPLFYRRKTIERLRVGAAYLESQIADESAIIEHFDIEDRMRA